jgi:hypothetical protein
LHGGQRLASIALCDVLARVPYISDCYKAVPYLEGRRILGGWSR